MADNTNTDTPGMNPDGSASADNVELTTQAQRSMKQTSKTAAENGEPDDTPVGPNDGPNITSVKGGTTPRRGDAPVGEAGTDGSSPYEEPNDARHEGRSS